MAIKDILVHLDGTARSERRLDIAARLAARHGAYLAGLFIVELALPTGVLGDPGGSAAMAFLGEMRDIALADAAKAEAAFHARTRRDGIPGEWRLLEGIGPEIVPLHARYADLAVLGQQDPDGPEGTGAILDAVLFGSGRPTLVVPYAGHFMEVGRRVLVAWNGGREAARATADAMPLLALAEQVTVLAVNPRRGLAGHGDQPAADIALHLARHGVTAAADQMVAPQIADGEALLNALSEKDIDLLVMGAYGHSRLRERVLGGVTRTILRSMTVPVLLSH